MRDSAFDLDQLLAMLVDRIADAVAARVVERTLSRPDEGLIDEATMAERLGISLPTLQRLRKDGCVPSIRLGRRILYSAKRVEEKLHEARGEDCE